MVSHRERLLHGITHCIEVALMHVHDASDIQAGKGFHQTLILVENSDVRILDLGVRVIIAAEFWQSHEEILKKTPVL